MTAVDALRRARPRDRFVRASLWLLGGSMAAALAFGGFGWSDAFSARRAANAERFLAEIRPYPLQGAEWDWSVFADWLGELLADRGLEAALMTLAISLLAVTLAAVIGLGLSVFAARNLATPEPFVAEGRQPSFAGAAAWRAAVATARGIAILMRAMPEYLLAFLLIGLIGPTAWPAVLALAIHNAGILGRLYAETFESVETRAPAALRGLGARRRQLATFALWPLTLPRLLLYFFYRWETCVREATVLGMLGVVSLGYWIADARTRGQYDSFVALILLGAAIVLVGDLVSAILRGVVRRA